MRRWHCALYAANYAQLLSAPRAVRYKGLSNDAEEEAASARQSTPGTMQSAIDRGQQKSPWADALWPRDHERCVGCGTTDRPHLARGRC
jgi:hypothetical protein